MSCRLSGAGTLLPPDFDALACASCFYFIYMVIPPYSQIYKTMRCRNGVLICTDAERDDCSCDNSAMVYNIPEFVRNKSSVTDLSRLSLNPALPEPFYQLTRQCCQAARSCCHNVLAKEDPEFTVCPSTWDGWQCFESAKEGAVTAACPSYIYGEFSRSNPDQGTNLTSTPVPPHLLGESVAAIKMCEPHGWGISAHTGVEWTDYTGCMAVQEGAQVKLFAGIVAFSVSVLCLIPAICLLLVFRPLRNNPMFIVHRHLLTSFLLSGLFYLFNCFFFIVDGAPGDILYFTNNVVCRLLFTVQLRFLRLSTFSWMLAEGVYLFRLLHTANHQGESLTPYKILCWGIPALLAAIYGVLRQLFDNEGCWVSPSVFSLIEWVYYAPCLVALCVNCLLVTFIMFILLKKLRCDPHLDRMQYRKAVRAALMLIPVFGLHFLFTIYRIPSTTHQIVNLVLDGLQGCAVSFIICYTNRSVLECIAKWWRGVADERDMRKEYKARTSLQETKAPLVQPLT